MSQTEQEKDLLDVRDSVKAVKITTFEYMSHLMTLNPEQLKHTGHKTIEAGLLFSMRFGIDRIKAQNAAYFKKYPD